MVKGRDDGCLQGNCAFQTQQDGCTHGFSAVGNSMLETCTNSSQQNPSMGEEVGLKSPS